MMRGLFFYSLVALHCSSVSMKIAIAFTSGTGTKSILNYKVKAFFYFVQAFDVE